jgi:hypothetical protein
MILQAHGACGGSNKGPDDCQLNNSAGRPQALPESHTLNSIAFPQSDHPFNLKFHSPYAYTANLLRSIFLQFPLVSSADF